MQKIFSIFLTAGLMLCMSASAWAEELYLHVQSADGNWTVLDLNQVNRLTFSGGQMKATDSKGTVVAQFPAASLTTMKVNDESQAGLDLVETPSGAAKCFDMSQDGRMLTAKIDGTLRVFTSTGQLAVEIPQVKAGQSVNLYSLPAGAYVINYANVARKALLK